MVTGAGLAATCLSRYSVYDHRRPRPRVVVNPRSWTTRSVSIAVAVKPGCVEVSSPRRLLYVRHFAVRRAVWAGALHRTFAEPETGAAGFADGPAARALSAGTRWRDRFRPLENTLTGRWCWRDCCNRESRRSDGTSHLRLSWNPAPSLDRGRAAGQFQPVGFAHDRILAETEPIADLGCAVPFGPESPKSLDDVRCPFSDWRAHHAASAVELFSLIAGVSV